MDAPRLVADVAHLLLPAEARGHYQLRCEELEARVAELELDRARWVVNEGLARHTVAILSQPRPGEVRPAATDESEAERVTTAALNERIEALEHDNAVLVEAQRDAVQRHRAAKTAYQRLVAQVSNAERRRHVADMAQPAGPIAALYQTFRHVPPGEAIRALCEMQVDTRAELGAAVLHSSQLESLLRSTTKELGRAREEIEMHQELEGTQRDVHALHRETLEAETAKLHDQVRALSRSLADSKREAQRLQSECDSHQRRHRELEAQAQAQLESSGAIVASLQRELEARAGHHATPSHDRDAPPDDDRPVHPPRSALGRRLVAAERPAAKPISRPRTLGASGGALGSRGPSPLDARHMSPFHRPPYTSPSQQGRLQHRGLPPRRDGGADVTPSRDMRRTPLARPGPPVSSSAVRSPMFDGSPPDAARAAAARHSDPAHPDPHGDSPGVPTSRKTIPVALADRRRLGKLTGAGVTSTKAAVEKVLCAGPADSVARDNARILGKRAPATGNRLPAPPVFSAQLPFRVSPARM